MFSLSILSACTLSCTSVSPCPSLPPSILRLDPWKWGHCLSFQLFVSSSSLFSVLVSLMLLHVFPPTYMFNSFFLLFLLLYSLTSLLNYLTLNPNDLNSSLSGVSSSLRCSITYPLLSYVILDCPSMISNKHNG